MGPMTEHRWGRRAMYVLSATAMVATLLLTASFIGSPAGGWAAQHRRAGVRLDRGTLEFAWCTHDVRWAGNGWLMSVQGSQARVINQSSSVWMPNSSDAKMLIAGGAGGTGGKGGNVLIVLTTMYVPLWPWAVVSAIGAGMLWWRLPRVFRTGCCQTCGYDLRGLRGGRCPECGEQSGAAFRMVAMLRSALGPTGFISFRRCV